MKPTELDNMVFVVAKFGASFEMTSDLLRKVKGEVRKSDSLRLISAVTLYHVWLLRGKPDKTEWKYRERVRYAIEVLAFFKSLPDDDRLNTGPTQKGAQLN
jgi:hypothetical protein